MADNFENVPESIQGPATRAVVPTLSDTVDLPNVTKGIHCNTAGALIGILAGDDTQQTFTLVAGAFYPYRFKRIFATGTAASVIAFV